VKKYIVHLLFLILIAAAFFFIYFSASSGMLMFEDTREKELCDRLSGAVSAFTDEADAVILGLQTLAQDEAIRPVFAKNADERVFEQGRAVLGQFAETWPYLRALCLFDTNNRIVLDVQQKSSAGEAAGASENVIAANVPRTFEFLEDGRAQIAVRLTAEDQADVGFVYALFDRSFITRFFETDQDGRFAVCALDKVLVVAGEGTLPGKDALPGLTSALLGSEPTPRAFGGRVYAQAQTEVCAQRIALQSDYSPHELPVLAIQLLVITALVFLALLLLLVLRMIHYQDTSAKRKIDRSAELSEEARVSAEEIIQATDLLYSQPEYSALDETKIAEGVPSLEEMPTLQTVLSHSEPGAPKRYNPELDRAVHAVTDTHGDAQTAPLPLLSDFSEMETVEPHDIAWYWSKIMVMLQHSYSASGIVLLCDDGKGTFTARYVHGYSFAQLKGCSISRSDRLYQQFAAKQKVLYIKEAAMQNRTLRALFPGIPASSVDQMVILPVIQNKEVAALLVILQPPGAAPFDQSGLQEIRNFSTL